MNSLFPKLYKILCSNQSYEIQEPHLDRDFAYCKAELEKFDSFTCDSYEIHIRYNSRHDVDNVILVSKFLSDTLSEKFLLKIPFLRKITFFNRVCSQKH